MMAHTFLSELRTRSAKGRRLGERAVLGMPRSNGSTSDGKGITLARRADCSKRKRT
jgi:hypothetical protein